MAALLLYISFVKFIADKSSKTKEKEKEKKRNVVLDIMVFLLERLAVQHLGRNSIALGFRTAICLRMLSDQWNLQGRILSRIGFMGLELGSSFMFWSPMRNQ